jgi:hypothetical protein
MWLLELQVLELQVLVWLERVLLEQPRQKRAL